jgi:putative DNA methylase
VTRKLIEVALPLEAINREAAREKSIRHGHPSTLHLWWARRPLAACRAVLFATLVDDPSSRPDRFPDAAAQHQERERLFRVIEALVDWDRIADPDVLDAAVREIGASNGDRPTIVDPFAGGASIPLEAQRLGLPTRGFDLNPVAALLGKALVELPADTNGSSAGRAPGALPAGATPTQALAADVRHYGTRLRDRARELAGRLYPPVAHRDGRELAPLTYIWARSVTCPNPACASRTPLVRSFVLRTRGDRVWAEPVVDDARDLTFRLRHGSGEPQSTVSRRGVRCVRCGETFSLDRVKESGLRGDMQPRLMAIVAAGAGGRRDFVEPSREQEQTAASAQPAWRPDE